MKKYGVYLLVAVFTLAVSGFGFTWYLLNRSVPLKNGSVDLEKLQKEVRVHTDKWGIPHIFAENEIDAYRTLGYVVASERLFQMDLMRRIASGRLSEILGEVTAKTDLLLRKLRIRKTMEDYFEKNKNKMNPQMIAYAEAFYDGVDQFIKNNPLPIEFVILNYTPEPFNIIDAMSVSGYMGLSFAEGMVGDVLFSELQKILPPNKLDQLRVSDKKQFKKINTTSNSQINLQGFFTQILKSHDFLEQYFYLFHGSNSWVVSGAITESGKPMLANDPHIAYSNPSVWFEAHIHTPGWELYGHYLPLVPFAILGHNREKAWAVTMSEVDDFDFYEEKLNPDNKDQVLYKGNWIDIKKEDIEIKIKGQPSIKSQVKISPHGPLMDGIENFPLDRSLSLAWTYYHPDNNSLTAFFELGLAKNLEEYKSAIKKAAAPGLNISWIDQSGTIAWWMMGKIPTVKNGVATDIVLQGWNPDHEYTGYLDFENNPHSVNPKEGYILSTNYKPLDKKYDAIDGYWQPSDRMDRLQELFSQKKIWTVDDMKKMQIDIQTFYAKPMIDKIIPFIEAQNEFEKNVLAELKNWDGLSTEESIGSSIFHVLNSFVLKNVVLDEVGDEHYKAFGKLADYWHFYKVLIETENSPWWDNITTKDKVETMKEIIQISFKESNEFLKKELGRKISNWQWGKIHTLELEHPLGKVKPLNYLFNIGPHPAPGSFLQLNNISFRRGTMNFTSHLGPSTRRVIDLGNPLMSWGIIPTGNSGHVNSQHYKDQVMMYLKGEYRAQVMHPDDIAVEREGVLVFK